MAKETEIYRPSGSLEPTNAIRGERYERRHQVRMNGKASDKIKSVLKEISQHGYSRRSPFSVGHVEGRMKKFSKENGIDIADGDLYMTVKSLSHATRATKERDKKTVSKKDIANFPQKRNSMDLFYDGKAFIYTDYRNKYIVHPNYEMKFEGGKKKKVNFITATKVTDRNEFRLPKYTKI